MQITPDVGLLHVDVERFVSSLMQLPYHRYHPATVQTPVGLLMPEGVDVRVVFYPHQAVDEPAERAIRPIGEYGIPWMRDHASLAGIYALINSGRFNNSALHACRRPVIAWMLGDPELARQHVRERLEEIETEGGRNAAGAREVYQRFAAALEERMASG